MADVLETVAPAAPVTAKRPVPTDLDRYIRNPGRKNPGSRPASSCVIIWQRCNYIGRFLDIQSPTLISRSDTTLMI
jgi:hypothetical protein